MYPDKTSVSRLEMCRDAVSNDFMAAWSIRIPMIPNGELLAALVLKEESDDSNVATLKKSNESQYIQYHYMYTYTNIHMYIHTYIYIYTYIFVWRSTCPNFSSPWVFPSDPPSVSSPRC